MGNYSFKTPDVGEGIVEVELVEWHIAVGDQIHRDQPIADVMTDKATVEIASPIAGTVVALGCQVGEMAHVGGELVRLQTEGDGNLSGAEATTPTVDTAPAESEREIAPVAPEPTAAPASVEPVQEVSSTPVAPLQDTPVSAPANGFVPQGTAKVLASPAVRRRAVEAAIDLALVTGSGPAGRIEQEDVDAYEARYRESGTPASQRVARTGVTEIPLRGLRRVIANKMVQSKQSIPHFSYVESIDLTALETLRSYLNQQRQADQPKLTLLPFLMVAMVRAVEKFPQANGHFDAVSEVMSQHEGVHIGMATMTVDGLKVPVIRHVEAKSIWQLATEIKQLAEAARDNRIDHTALSGSTITLSSLGALGGVVSTPIINHPEVAIVGVNKAEDTVVVREGQMVIRRMMNLSSSFDHRVMDGYNAAEMIQYMKGLLEQPAALFIDPQ